MYKMINLDFLDDVEHEMVAGKIDNINDDKRISYAEKIWVYNYWLDKEFDKQVAFKIFTNTLDYIERGL